MWGYCPSKSLKVSVAHSRALLCRIGYAKEMPEALSRLLAREKPERVLAVGYASEFGGADSTQH
jgi:hypothetical protein